MQSFSWGFFLLAAGLRFVPWVTKTIRLMNWMALRQHAFTFWEGFRISIMSELGAIISPTIIGGEPIKAGMLYQRGISAGEAVSLTSIPMVEDLTFYFIGIPIALVFSQKINLSKINDLVIRVIEKSGHFLPIAGGVLLLLILVILFLRRAGYLANIKYKLVRFWRDFSLLYNTMIKKGKLRFATNVMLSAIHWTSRYSVVAALVLSLGYKVDFVSFFLLQWAVFTLMSLIPTPGATGGAEAAFLILFGALLPEKAIGTVLLGWRFLDFYFLGILGIIILGMQRIIKNMNQ